MTSQRPENLQELLDGLNETIENVSTKYPSSMRGLMSAYWDGVGDVASVIELMLTTGFSEDTPTLENYLLFGYDYVPDELGSEN